MKKQNLLKTLIIITMASIFSNCGNDCKNEVHLYLPQDFKDCFVFPAGSWWVYSVNGEFYDTLTLESSNLAPPTHPIPGECIVVESFASCYSTNHDRYFDNINACIYYEKSQPYNVDTVYYTFIKPEWYNNLNSINSQYLYSRYFGAGLYGLKATNEMEISKQLEKGGGYFLEAINDTNIDNVTRDLIIFKTIDFDLLDGYFQANPDSLPPFRVYYARGIGMIKKEMYNGDVWTLEDYFIND